MSLDNWARIAIRTGMGREISKREALEIIRQNEADGLVLQPSNTQKVEYICSCCGCCCGMLGLQKMLPRPVDYWSTTYYATIDSGNCTACGLCEERCQVNALKNDESLGVYSVNLDRCIGCGNCVASCATGAIALVKKVKAKVPPVDSENLFDTILAKRKRNPD
jgi:formate hydrogenlyase subunit 6/NADH:ubiquinone oxidoreductase subunit I